MKINFFPQNYKPRYSLQETYKYISEFIYKLTNILNSEYTYVDPLIITNKNESQDAYMNNNRVVFFDNLNSDVISQLITEQSVYLSNVIFENDLSNI
jgi:hypothetical protein